MSDLGAAKQLAGRFWSSLGDSAARSSSDALRSDGSWELCHPFPKTPAHGLESILWETIEPAVSGMNVRWLMIMAGIWKGEVYVSGNGYITGFHIGRFLGLEPTFSPSSIRFGVFHRISDGRIGDSKLLLDLPDFFHRQGQDLIAGRYDQSEWPGPETGDGLVDQVRPGGADALDLVERMAFDGLLKYDGKSLESMGMDRFWDRDRMRWFGPAGIGSSLSLKGFEKYHQEPFLAAFPDRGGINHFARFAECQYVCSTGWPSIRATHSATYLGMPANDQAITMRVMDWWRVEDGLLVENWVLIDLLNLASQMGHELLPNVARFPDTETET